MTEKKPKKRATKAVKEAASAFGRAGGKANARKRGKKGMAEIGRLGAEARWGKEKLPANAKK